MGREPKKKKKNRNEWEGEEKGQEGNLSGYSSRDLHCSRCTSRFQHSLRICGPFSSPSPFPPISFLFIALAFFSRWKKTPNIPFLCLSLFPNQRKRLLCKKKTAAGETSLRQIKYIFFRTCFLLLSWEVYIYIYIYFRERIFQ